MYLNIYNKNITSLKEYFETRECGDIRQITELECSWNQLTSLEGCPPNVQQLLCSNNMLTTLKGCPSSVKNLQCQGNQLTTLIGCPSSVKVLYCCYNRLASLEGCPENMYILFCSNNHLNNLDWCPRNVSYLNYNNNPLGKEWQDLTPKQALDKLYEQDVQKGVSIINQIFEERRTSILKQCVRDYWYNSDRCLHAKVMYKLSAS